ncbi:MAG: hypothetical protein R3C39_00800 [Dehalococcoidia bacterium]
MPDDRVLQALLAGLIAGAAVAFATTAIALVALSRSPSWIGRSQNLKVPMPLVGVAFVNGLMLWWTALGLVLGAVLLRFDSDRPGAGLGSPNAWFTAVIVGLVLASMGLAWFVRGRPAWPLTASAVVAALSFGWLLPVLGL